MSIINYINLLPDNFKQVRDNNSTNDLEKYELNPLLLVSHLLNITTSDVYQHGLEDFKRTFRLKDTILPSTVLYQPEIYKGYLAFKSTKNDLQYFLRQIELEGSIEELAPSGLIDITENMRFIDGSWLISNPTTIYIYSLPNEEIYMSKSCEIGVTIIIKIKSYDLNKFSRVFSRLPSLLLNRLAIYTILGYTIFKIVAEENEFEEIQELLESAIEVNAIESLESVYFFNNLNPEIINNENPFIIGQNHITEALGNRFSMSTEVFDRKLINNSIPFKIGSSTLVGGHHPEETINTE